MGSFNDSGNYCRGFANNSIISMPKDNLHEIIDSRCGIRCARSTTEVQMGMMRWVTPGYVSFIDIVNHNSYSDLRRTSNLQSDFNGVYTCTLGNSIEQVLHIGMYITKPGMTNFINKINN